MTETYGWGDTIKCGALCALNCVTGCAGNMLLAAAGVASGELSNYEAP